MHPVPARTREVFRRAQRRQMGGWRAARTILDAAASRSCLRALPRQADDQTRERGDLAFMRLEERRWPKRSDAAVRRPGATRAAERPAPARPVPRGSAVARGSPRSSEARDAAPRSARARRRRSEARPPGLRRLHLREWTASSVAASAAVRDAADREPAAASRSRCRARSTAAAESGVHRRSGRGRRRLSIRRRERRAREPRSRRRGRRKTSSATASARRAASPHRAQSPTPRRAAIIGSKLALHPTTSARRSSCSFRVVGCPARRRRRQCRRPPRGRGRPGARPPSRRGTLQPTGHTRHVVPGRRAAAS